jgi:hypothetical protein
MLSAHSVAADLLTQADGIFFRLFRLKVFSNYSSVFLVSSPSRYKQRWLGIDRNFVLLTKTANGEVFPIVDTMTCGSSMGSRQWFVKIVLPVDWMRKAPFQFF